VEFQVPGEAASLASGPLVRVSAAGLAFHLEANPSMYPVETFIERIEVRVQDAVFTGGILGRNVRPVNDRVIELGCLFHPAEREEDRWHCFLAGLECGRSPAQERRP
jgi:hypothetical protein